MEIKLPTSKEHVRRMQTLYACYAREKLFKSLDYTTVEIDAIKIIFEHHFDLQNGAGITLSQSYTLRRPSWMAEYLTLLKIDFLQIKQEDRRGSVHMPGCGNADYQKMLHAVYIKDCATHLVALSGHMDNVKYFMENDEVFESQLRERVEWLQRNRPHTYAKWKNNVDIHWEKYELPCSYPPAASSYFARAHKLMRW